MEYPIKLEKNKDGTFTATFYDMPGMTEGDTREEAIFNAEDCLQESIAALMAMKKDIPAPSRVKNAPLAVLSPRTTAKVMLYRQLREQNVSITELARRLGWKHPQALRLTDLYHKSDLDQLEQAFTALGKRLVVEVVNRPPR